MLTTLRCFVLSFIVLSFVSACDSALQEELNVYSARNEALIKPLLDRFSEEYGIKVNLVTGKDDTLFARLASEGRNSPADILITTDAGRLYRAKEAGLLGTFNNLVINKRIPESYRDPEGYWYGLSLRSRVFIYAPDRVEAAQLSTYEALGEPQWQGRICVRSSGSIYNQSLVASMIAHDGMAQTEAWLARLVNNFARAPQGGDRDQIRAVAAGLCDLAIVNSYYYGAMLTGSDDKDRQLASSLALHWPNQEGRGAHMNISGAAVTRHAPNKEVAIKLITFLTEQEAQAWYAEVNNEYPVVEGVDASETLKSFGEFKADTIAADILGKNNKDAVKAMDRAGWK